MNRISIVCLTLAIALASSCEKMPGQLDEIIINVTNRTPSSIIFDVTLKLPKKTAYDYGVGFYYGSEDPMQMYNDGYLPNYSANEEMPYIFCDCGYTYEGQPGTFTYEFELEDLEPGDYYIRAYIGSQEDVIQWGALTRVINLPIEKPKLDISQVDVYSNAIKVTYEIENSGFDWQSEGFYLCDNRTDLEKKKSSLKVYKNEDTVYGLEMDKDYYIQAFAENELGTGYSWVKIVRTKTYEDLSAEETANCYIVSKEGHYAFKPCKATKSDILDGTRVEVYWETVNTGTAPEVGSVISNAFYNDKTKLIEFDASGTPGNALIAMYDDTGTIVWSWHIWSTEKPKDQVYFNNAGTMMDRNLGALSTSKEGNLSRGMIYEWGRKDPFPGSLEGNVAIVFTHKDILQAQAQSYSYAVQNPGKKINGDPDWCTDVAAKGRWSAKEKTVNDPCPPGYHIPSGLVWTKALGGDQFSFKYIPDWTGFDFATGDYILGSDTSIWYPATGVNWENAKNHNWLEGEPIIRIDLAYYWADATDSYYAAAFLILCESSINVVNTNDAMARAVAVRCQKK